MTDIIEVWKPVRGLEKLYDISNHGRVRSKHFIGRPVEGEDRIKKAVPNQKGYLRVQLCSHGIVFTAAVHRLVLQAFVGPAPSEHHEANHKDGVKSNNRIDNLEWLTRVENNAHSVANGLWEPHLGEFHGRAKLKESDITRIRSYEGRYAASAVAKQYGVTAAAIKLIWKRRNWAHVK